MDVRIRKFYYKVLMYKGQAFSFESFPARNFSEAFEKAIKKGVFGETPDEIHIQKTQDYTML